MVKFIFFFVTKVRKMVLSQIFLENLVEYGLVFFRRQWTMQETIYKVYVLLIRKHADYFRVNGKISRYYLENLHGNSNQKEW